jgi:hypothetical protein
MIKRKVKLKITSASRQTTRVVGQSLSARCPVCGPEVEMITSAEAAGILEVDPQTFDHLVAGGRICGSWTFGSDGRGRGQWGSVQADLSIAINGRDVTVTRRDRTSSLQATYRGTLSSDGTQVTGQVTWCCDSLGNRSGTGRARILGARSGNGSGGSRGGSSGSSTGSGGGSGGVGDASGPAVLQLVEVIQEPKCATWGDTFTCNRGQISSRASYGNATYRWTEPPQQVAAGGFTINISVFAQAVPRSRVAAGIVHTSTIAVS